MRTAFLILIATSLMSCAIIYNGVVKNEYDTPITINSKRGVKGISSALPSESVVVPIFETSTGTCIEVSGIFGVKYYQVSAPPKWARVNGIWNVNFSISVSEEGAHYLGKHGEKYKLHEIQSCETPNK